MDVWTCLPIGRLRCCGGSSPSVHPGDSPWRRRTPWTPAPRTQRPRCSRPTSSPPRVDLCGGSRNRTWWTCPRRRSASLRMPRLLKRWRGRKLTPGWLRRARRRHRKEKERHVKHERGNSQPSRRGMKRIPAGNKLLTLHFIVETVRLGIGICGKQTIGRKNPLATCGFQDAMVHPSISPRRDISSLCSCPDGQTLSGISLTSCHP